MTNDDCIKFVRRDPEFRPDVGQYVRRIKINEMTDLVIRNVAKLSPIPQRGDGRLLPFRENATLAQAGNIGELVGDGAHDRQN